MDWELEPSMIPGRTRGQMESYRETAEPVCSCDICGDIGEARLSIKFDGQTYCPRCAEYDLDRCPECGELKKKGDWCCDYD